VSTDLTRIGNKASKEPTLVFTSLYHHVTDVDNLRACYEALPAKRAVGIDGISKSDYGKGLESNLKDLSARLKRMGYRPKPKRRSYIPKPGSEKGRPLGISCLEDKIVELAVKRVLEPLYEPIFVDNSYGYRPGRSQHACIDELGRTIQQKRVSYIAEADIKGFFNEVQHEWLGKFLQKRVGDPRVIRLINRMLKSGIMEDGLFQETESGTSQGSILSPLLSNIYLHYSLDQWVKAWIKDVSKGEGHFYRFADDFLTCFQYKGDADKFLPALSARLEKFGLQLAPEKTGTIEFGRFARENARKLGKKPQEFTFLGFTHYCGKTKEGHFKVKRRTSRKKFGESLRKYGDWVHKTRGYLRKGEILRQGRLRIIGHLNYYAITDNSAMCSDYVFHATRLTFKWLNRKSQRRSYTWKGFNQVLNRVNWPEARVRKDLNPFRRAETF